MIMILEDSITKLADDKATATNNGTEKRNGLEKYSLRDITEVTRDPEEIYTIGSAGSKIYTYKNIYIETLNSDIFTLIRPIPVSLEYDGEAYIANNYDLELYGYAEIETEAINDLRKSIVEFYEDLKDEKDLGIFLERKVKYCKNIIREI
jgi:hypothetical protein